MTGFRSSGRGTRPWIATVLAYALALQAMLAAAVGVQHAAAASASTDPAVICFGMGATPQADDGSAPARLHQHPCMACAIAGLPALPPAQSAALPLRACAPAVYSPLPAAISAAYPETPRLSQGPPRDA